jgi:hypothetical protein
MNRERALNPRSVLGRLSTGQDEPLLLYQFRELLLTSGWNANR